VTSGLSAENHQISSDGSGIDRAGISSITGAVILMGLGSVLAKAAEIEGPVLAFHRSWGAAVLYLGLAVLFKGRLNRDTLLASMPGGIVFGVQLALFFSSISLTTVANTTVIIALQPVVVLLFVSRRFGEDVTRSDLVFSLLAILGVAIVVFGSSASPSWSPLGDLLAVAALMTWTAYFVLSKRARETVGVVEYQGLSLIFASLAILPIAVLFSRTIDPGAGKWWWVLAMIATPGTGHLLMNWAHPRVPIGLVSQMTLLSPVVAVAVAAFVVEGEAVNALQIIGMIVVLVSLALTVRAREQRSTS